MFKKNVWVIALLAAAAFAIMIGGCIEAAEDEGGVETDVVKLSEVIKDAPVGVIMTDDQWDAIFKKSPFAKCNGEKGDGAKYEILNEGGVKKLKVFGMQYDWGEGLDVRSKTSSSNVGANFKKGDEIQIKGTSSPGGIIANQTGGSGLEKLDNWASGEAFDQKFTLSAVDAGKLQGNGKGLRLHYDDNVPKRKGVIIFEEIYVRGKRTGIDAAPDYSIPGSGSYKVPEVPKADTGKYYYLDLNAAVKGQLVPEPDLPKVTALIDKDELTFSFTNNDQGVFIPFDDDTKAVLVDKIKNYYTFDVVIVGSGNTVVRSCLGVDKGSDFDVTIMTTPGKFSETQLTSNQAFQSGRKADDLAGFVIQARRVTGNANTFPSQITIRSIKITPKAPSTPIVEKDKPLTIGITKPVAVSPATDKPVDIKDEDNNKVATGVIKWSPAIPTDGNWTAADYVAIITVVPEAGYYIPTYLGAAFGDTAVYRVIDYNPATKEVSVTFK